MVLAGIVSDQVSYHPPPQTALDLRLVRCVSVLARVQFEVQHVAIIGVGQSPSLDPVTMWLARIVLQIATPASERNGTLVDGQLSSRAVYSSPLPTQLVDQVFDFIDGLFLDRAIVETDKVVHVLETLSADHVADRRGEKGIGVPVVSYALPLVYPHRHQHSQK